jgi:hypothetical protein
VLRHIKQQDFYPAKASRWRLSGFFCVGNILLQGGGIYILNATGVPSPKQKTT